MCLDTAITDADFADDIALLYDKLAGAHALLFSLESAANCAGLHLNESKTECMPINVRNNQEIRTLSNNILKCVEDYKYLGSHIQSSEKDFNIRKGIAWTACNKMNKIWKSDGTPKLMSPKSVHRPPNRPGTPPAHVCRAN